MCYRCMSALADPTLFQYSKTSAMQFVSLIESSCQASVFFTSDDQEFESFNNAHPTGPATVILVVL